LVLSVTPFMSTLKPYKYVHVVFFSYYTMLGGFEIAKL
jgi:hypothetical protein